MYTLTMIVPARTGVNKPVEDTVAEPATSVTEYTIWPPLTLPVTMI